jgi:hypothetical protein
MPCWSRFIYPEDESSRFLQNTGTFLTKLHDVTSQKIAELQISHTGKTL